MRRHPSRHPRPSHVDVGLCFRRKAAVGGDGAERRRCRTRRFGAKGLVWLRLLEAKTTKKDQAPRLPTKGRAARALVHWLDVTKLTSGPLFRPISLSGHPQPRRLASDVLRTILRHRLVLAGLPADFATPHGLRAGFLTQAALDGAPLAAATKLSLHRSAVQAQKYYADVEISENPATDLLGD